MMKRLTFSTVTTYEFPLTYGGSAVPDETGPPIGLAPVHTRASVTALSSAHKPRRVAKWPHADRVAVLQNADFTPAEIAAICFEAIDIRRSRLETLEEIQKLRERERKLKRKELRRAKRARRDADSPDEPPQTVEDTTTSQDDAKRLCTRD
ncbi:hypothetical protein ACHHYP_15519 [Achlya hypogyna]|uniref:Cysteine/serine-rich nuclear protein N-terminal domain-containing protein n=1 Tax=Achlya hypogyna TaxID=1202772 RepID=A0A1V9YAU1_ACHHY|nr:hypothetical protein ACHHYP_15519 [Achlya hypogyna]